MNYKYLVPIALVGLLGLSVFMAMKNNTEKENNYNLYLEQARSAASYEIYVDAEENYKEALKIHKSLDIYNELLDVYVAHDQESYARRLVDEMIKEFSEDGRAYAMGAQVYVEYERYPLLNEIYGKYKNKKLFNDDMEEIYESARWKYKVNGGYAHVDNYSSGLCAMGNDDGKWGYIDNKGSTFIDCKYKYAGPFVNELAPVQTMDGIWYFIDQEGEKRKVLNEIENVDQIGFVVEAIPVRSGNKWAYYSDDQELLSEGYDEALALANGYAAVKIGQEWYIIDKGGRKLTEQGYTEIAYDDRGVAYRGVYFAKLNGVYNLYNSEGGVVGTDSYQDAHIFNAGGKYAAVKIDGRWGFVDINGSIVIDPQYEDARSFANGAAAVKKDGLWGIIDESGKMVIDNHFEDMKDLTENGRILVKDSGTWKLLKLLIYQD